MSLRNSIRSLGWHFADEDTDLGKVLDSFLNSRHERPRLLGLGEPMHGAEAFPLLRNHTLRYLVQHQGYRSIAIESDCLAALVVNEYVTSGEGDLNDVLSTGFSHGFGDMDSNRDLITWIRSYNEEREPADQVRFYGFDAPAEMSGAPSPRTALTVVHRYLTAHLEPDRIPHGIQTIDSLIGDEQPWTNPAAAMDPTQSMGRSARALDLRVITDDLLGVLESESPGLQEAGSPGEYDRACLFARTAQGLLRYHAAMAERTSERLSRMLAVRDAIMAANLLALVETESPRGPSLVFAHNQHLRRDRSAWQLEEMDLRWWSAGAITATRLGTQYAVIASDLGTATDLGLPEPGPSTLEGVLADATENTALYPTDTLTGVLSQHPALAPRAKTPAEVGYFALDATNLSGIDAIAFIKNVSQNQSAP